MDHRYRRVFAAYDKRSNGSEVARRALELAKNKAELCLGYVVDAAEYAAARTDFNALAQATKPKIEAELEDVLNEAAESDTIPRANVRVAAGPVGKTLIAGLIKPFSPDVVVCSSRCLTDMQYFLSKSVSAQLIRALRCDILVVK